MHDEVLIALKNLADEFQRGFDEMRSGVGDLRSGVGDLRSGVGDLRSGVGDLRSGLGGVNNHLDAIEMNIRLLQFRYQNMIDLLNNANTLPNFPSKPRFYHYATKAWGIVPERKRLGVMG